ncbi:MAG: hypothetical protein M1831_003563 [Alyxoria varia]|nr:MAG: hypothetical protein M1831_003563 [Alyxoria varia]
MKESSRAQNTCEWVFKFQQFQNWRSGLPPLLWILGEHGCGKTTLISFLRDQMREQMMIFDNVKERIQYKSTTCSFFCDDKYKDCMSAKVILQGLIWQIVSQRHDLIEHVLNEFQDSRPWHYDQLLRILRAVLDDPKLHGVCIIIDALDVLDEFDTDGRRRLVQDLSTYLGKKSTNRDSPTNVVFSTRPSTMGNLEQLEASSALFKLDDDKVIRGHVVSDIKEYVLQGLLSSNHLPAKSQSIRQAALEPMANTIAKKSEGSFLWAHLILKDLKLEGFMNIKDVEDFIKTCPSDFDQIYNKSLRRVTNRYKDVVFRSLEIMVAARRPLTWMEFTTALFIKECHRSLRDVEKEILGWENLEGYFRNILNSIVRIDEYHITLRHHAAKDFLLNKADPDSGFRISINNAESTLARSCINFLVLKDFGKKRSDADEMIENWQDSGLANIALFEETTPVSPEVSQDQGKIYHNALSQFFEYAASNWAYHYSWSGDSTSKLSDAALKPSMNPSTLANWAHQFRKSYRRTNNLPKSLNPLIVSAYFGHTLDAKRLIADGEYDSSLSAANAWACRMGHLGVVNLLITQGGFNIREMHEGASAFSWASAGGFLEIVDTLLEHDKALINVNMVDKLLETEGVDVNVRNLGGKTPVFSAVSDHELSDNQRTIFLNLLDDDRTDINLRDMHGRTLLSYAAESGVSQVIRELLDHHEKRTQVEKLLDDSGDKMGVSPLSHAVRLGNVETVRLLCRAKRLIGAQLQSVDNLDGANVLDRAARLGNVEIIKELVKRYPEGVHSRNKTGRTPLSVAIWENNKEVVRVLLEAGADPNCPDETGRTPICFRPNKIEMVKVLLEYGADISLADHEGHAALWYAERHSEEAAARLRELGAR